MATSTSGYSASSRAIIERSRPPADDPKADIYKILHDDPVLVQLYSKEVAARQGLSEEDLKKRRFELETVVEHEQAKQKLLLAEQAGTLFSSTSCAPKAVQVLRAVCRRAHLQHESHIWVVHAARGNV